MATPVKTALVKNKHERFAADSAMNQRTDGCGQRRDLSRSTSSTAQFIIRPKKGGKLSRDAFKPTNLDRKAYAKATRTGPRWKLAKVSNSRIP